MYSNVSSIWKRRWRRKLGPVGVAGVGGAVDDQTPGLVAVFLELVFDLVSCVVFPRETGIA